MKRLCKVAAVKPVWEPTTEFEAGEIREVHVLPHKPDEKSLVCTSSLPQKKSRTFKQGSISHSLEGSLAEANLPFNL